VKDSILISCGKLRNMRQKSWRKKRGRRPSESLLRRIKRHHRRIHLMWAPKHRKWFMVEHALDGRIRPVGGPIEGHPRYSNTLKVLNESVILRREWQQWLEETEHNDELRRAGHFAPTSAKDKIAEGHDRMYHLHRSGKAVSFAGSKRKRRRR